MKLQQNGLTRGQQAYVDLLLSAARRIEDEAPTEAMMQSELHSDWLRERAQEVTQDFVEANREEALTGWVERGFWRVFANTAATSPFVEVVADSGTEALEVAKGAGRAAVSAAHVGICLVRSDERPRKGRENP